MKNLIISAFLFILFISPAHAEINLKNSVNDISYEEKTDITSFLAACADIMRYDRDSFDFDTLMKYILCTHGNFAALTGTSPQTDLSDPAPDGISIVSGDYIDNILSNVFKLAPEHPTVDALVSRGFCYSGGLYYYRNAFTVDFHTQIQDLKTVYKLGGGIYYVVFSDTYYENGAASPEESFAVIQKSNPLPYSLIRLGMGENALSEREIISYTPQETYRDPRWQTPRPDYSPGGGFSFYTLLIIVSVSAVIFIFGVAALMRELRRK